MFGGIFFIAVLLGILTTDRQTPTLFLKKLLSNSQYITGIMDKITYYRVIAIMTIECRFR
jgi:hypothetical protein